MNNNNFTRLYIIFGSFFVIISFVFILLSTVYSLDLFLVYSIINCLGVISFVICIRKKIRSIIDRLNNDIENAINHKNINVQYDETSVGTFENKLYHYILTTDTKATEREDEKNKIKSLISNISHQTKTPVANILLYSQLLEEKNLDNDSKKIVNEIVNQSEKLSFLTQKLVNMSRLETGIINFNKQITNVYTLLNKAVSAIENKATLKCVSIKLECDKDIQLNIDSKWTEEAILNILDNAVKYTNQGGNIIISTIKYEMFTRINITDTGIGIKKEEFNNIFKRFYRSIDVCRNPGVGIGLYLSKEIISNQGGYIKVKSKYNEGSTFSIFLRNIN